MADTPALKRVLTLPLLTLYGLGTTVGAGIYVLVGEVAGQAGYLAPVAFLFAAVLAGISALSFAELSVRFPVSAGEAVYVQEGLGSSALASIIGFMVVGAGVVSSATIINGFAGYFQRIIDVPEGVALIGIAALLVAIAIWGIAESVIVAAIVTVIEIGGLIVIIGAAGINLESLPAITDEINAAEQGHLIYGVLVGGVLAFYAFIGFEDMVNVAEEVKDVRRVMPRAIILTVITTTLFYVAISTVAVLTIPPSDLAISKAPLTDIFEKATGRGGEIISLISIVAVLNGALIQIVMASRVLYGLANKGLLHAAFARVHPKTHTPILATIVVGTTVLTLALSFELLSLAQITSLITLTVFALVNLALVRIKLRGERDNPDNFVPLWVPTVGFAVCAGFALFQLAEFMTR